MNPERDVTPIVRSWLEVGPTALPDRVLDNVLDRLPATPQRRPPWRTRRLTLMSSPLRVAVVAAAIGLFAVIGLNIAPRWGDGIGTDVPSPSLVAGPSLAPSPAASPATTLSLDPPADVDAYVRQARDGLVDLPALTVTVVEDEGTKARYMYDGAGLLHHDHFSNATNEQPAEYRIFSRDVMAELSDLNGEPVWLENTGQGHPLAELAGGTGLQTYCETAWEYVGLEYLIDRPAHHVACAGSELWLDLETRLPLRSIRVQGDGLPTIRFTTTELKVGPQPAELFQPPEGLRVVTSAQFECASEPACQSPAPEETEQPIATPAPAPGDFAVPSDLGAFVADVLANYVTPPALEIVVGESEYPVRYRSDGAGRYRTDYGVDAKEPADYLVTNGHVYKSFPQQDGSVLWGDNGPVVDAGIPDLGLGQECREGWEHRGFDLVLDRPAHHLICGYDEYWIDRDWLLVTRHQRNPDPLEYDTNVEQVLELRLGPMPAELFELPADAAVYDAACFRRGRLTCEPSPSGAIATGTGPALTWSMVDREGVSNVAWLGDRFVASDGEGIMTSTDGVAWESIDTTDPDYGYRQVLKGSGTIATWDDAMVGWDAGAVWSVRAPGPPVAKSDFDGEIGALGIGPAGIVARVHSGIDFDAFVTGFLGPDWVGQIKQFYFADGVLHIATDDGRSADIVMADHGLGPGDVADRGYGWFSVDGATWTLIPGFPSNVEEIVGVTDGFIARGESMWHSPDGMTWDEIGDYTEGPMLGWQDGALIRGASGGLDFWTAAGSHPLPVSTEFSPGSMPLGNAMGTGPLGLVTIGNTDVLYTPDGREWRIGGMPEAMYASGGGRRPPTVAVGDDAVLVLMWSGGDVPVPTLWRGTPDS